MTIIIKRDFVHSKGLIRYNDEFPQRYDEYYYHDGFNDGGDGRITLQIVDGKAA